MYGVFRSSYSGMTHANAVTFMHICRLEYVLKFLETLVKHINSLLITPKSASNGRNFVVIFITVCRGTQKIKINKYKATHLLAW